MSNIEGVEVKELIAHSDERGYFKELIRSTDPFFSAGFGQLSHSLVFQNVVKAWHLHKYQTQWTYAASGTLQVVLYDLREKSKTYGKFMKLLASPQNTSIVYSFPPGVAHGYKCVDGPANVIYVTSGQYDLNDEIRLAHDDPKINYDWLSTDIK